MTSPGRNAPCPCGSGRKYKRCCGHGGSSELRLVDVSEAGSSAGSARRATISRANGVKDRDARLTSLLTRYAKRQFGDEWMVETIDDYLDGAGQLDEAELQIAVPWALFVAPAPDDAISIAEMALRDPRAAGLDSQMLILLGDQLEAWLGIWEIEHVDPGVGMEMTDLLTKETRFVYETIGSRTAVLHDTVLARVVDSDGVSFVAGLFPRSLGPSDAEHLAKQIRRTCHVRTRPVPRELLCEPALQRSMIDGWRRTVEERSAGPMLTNTDDDLLVLTNDRFDIVGSYEAVLSRMMAFPGVNDPEDETGGDAGALAFVITRPDNAIHASLNSTVIGRVVVGKRAIRAESNSVERADRLRKELTAHLGKLVRFRLRDEATAAALVEHARSSCRPGRSRTSEPDAEFAEIARQMREEYMRGWMDLSVPALGGLTPRAAAAGSAASRKALETLLKEFEYHEARQPAKERLDIGRLRRELLGDR